MSLSYVNLSSDVYFVCVSHALSTEREEIVGLLVGEVDEQRVAHVLAVVILRRSDKRKDRVEISPEQLSNASTEAERLSCMLKRPIRIIGWYHSHPKLTVWPSPIDVNTQDSYQLMDDGFIGMIFSVFNEDPSKKGGRVQMTCFQSQTVIEDCNIEKKRLDVPVHLVPASHISNVCMKALIKLPRFLCQEEQLAYQITNTLTLDFLTRVHNSSVYLRSMGQIAEVVCGPLIKMLEERIINNEIKRKKLQSKKKEINMVFEQIQTENARSGAPETVAATSVWGDDNMETIQCSQASDVGTVLEAHTLLDSVALDDILIGNIPKSSVESLHAVKSDVILSKSSPLSCSADELCISSSVETTSGNGFFQESMPSTSTVSPNQDVHVESTTSSSKKEDEQSDSPADSSKENSQ